MEGARLRAFFAFWGLDRLAERVRRGLQPVADLGQLSRREVDALLLDLRALLLFVGPLPLAVGALAEAPSAGRPCSRPSG